MTPKTIVSEFACNLLELENFRNSISPMIHTLLLSYVSSRNKVGSIFDTIPMIIDHIEKASDIEDRTESTCKLILSNTWAFDDTIVQSAEETIDLIMDLRLKDLAIRQHVANLSMCQTMLS